VKEGQDKSKAACQRGADEDRVSVEKKVQVTHDQVYLLERINEGTTGSALTIPGVQRLMNQYGLGPVSDGLRAMRMAVADGLEVRKPYPYLVSILKGLP
jgi:hypothetical protein